MEPLSAVSIAAAVVQFVDFGTRLLSTSVEIYKSPSGQTAEEVEVTTVLGDLTSLASRTREIMARHETPLDRAGDDEMSRFLSEIDHIVLDFQGATDSLLARGIVRLYGKEGLNKKSLGSALISISNASKTSEILSRLGTLQRRILQFALLQLW